jgi:hypothetical protein
MKKSLSIFVGIITLIVSAHLLKGTVYATNPCTYWSPNPLGGTEMLTEDCVLAGQATLGGDYSSGTDDATNGYRVVLNSHNITINQGIVSAYTQLWVGSIVATGSGSISIASQYSSILPGSKCYVPDCDSDGYSPTPNTCTTTATTCANSTAYKRRNKLSSLATDCYDLSANAYPGSAYYGTTTRGTSLLGNDAAGNTWNSYDFNCDGSPTKQYPTVYSCSGCTDSNSYASTQNTTTGFSSTTACGASGTLNTVTNATCPVSDPVSCAGDFSASTVTQACN